MNEECIITLECFQCGKTTDVVVTRPPRFGFELVSIANDAGLKGVLDFANSRALVFCNNECFNNCKTKDGRIRKRPKKEVR